MVAPGDALVIVDVQRDFLPGGAQPVPRGDEVVPVLNRWLEIFAAAGAPIFATRCWHPAQHCSFRAQGGPWAPHCVAGSDGARFAGALRLPPGAQVISKATTPERDAYSGFDGTGLDEELRRRGARRLFIGGLATDYCVRATVAGALARGYDVELIVDGTRAIDPARGRSAVEQLVARGARRADLSRLSAGARSS
jgi:nicotinamidase/pyrazinamidase